MNSPLVSVIIPTYRHRHLVLETLESVWAQTFQDYEVIVVNDGSPDDTAALLQPLAARGRIRYIEQENQGQAAARNHGLAEARGEFIAFLDDDDLWPPDKLDWQLEALRCNPILGMVGGFRIYFDELPPPVVQPHAGASEVTFHSLFSGCPFSSPGQTLICTALLREVGGFDTTIWGADDFDLYMRLSLKKRLQKQPRIALFYRRHASNASIDFERMLYNSIKVIRKHLGALPLKSRNEAAKRARTFLYNYLGHKVVRRAGSDIRSGAYTYAIKRLRSIDFLYPRIVSSPKLARQFVGDLLCCG